MLLGPHGLTSALQEAFGFEKLQLHVADVLSPMLLVTMLESPLS